MVYPKIFNKKKIIPKFRLRNDRRTRLPVRRIIKKLRKIKDSLPQRILFEELKRKFNPRYLRYNYPVRTWVIRNGEFVWNIRYIDIAYPKEKIGFEYDGEFYHNKRKDRKRDKELKRIGWKVIHINKYNMQDILDNL